MAQRALRIAEERQERGHAAHALLLVGDAAARADPGDPADAVTAYRKGLALAEALEMAPLVARFRLALGEVDLGRGEPARAREHLAAAIELLRALDWPD